MTTEDSFQSQVDRPVRSRMASIRISGAEVFVLLALLVFGTMSVLTIPLGGGWDEETHVIRAWEIAYLRFIPNEVPRNELPFPMIYWDLSYRRPTIVRPVDPDFWSRYGELPIDAYDYIYSELPTRSIYTPLTLAPHAFAFRYLGLSARLPALPVYYGARFLGLLAYAFLTWAAVRVLPFGKWTGAILALTPTAVFQAATIGADPISNGLGFLFAAAVLSISERRWIEWKAWSSIVILGALVYLGKPNMVVLAFLPLFLFAPRQFKLRYGYFTLAFVLLLLALVEAGGWILLAHPGFTSPAGDLDPTGQLIHVAREPLAFARALLSDAATYGQAYVRQWIAELGYLYWSVPTPVYALHLLALAAAILVDSENRRPNLRVRFGLGITFIIGVVGIFLSLYVSNTPVASEEILGVQGRYFSPWVSIGALAVVGAVSWKPFSRRTLLAPTFATLSLVLFLIGLRLSYHVPCGTAYFEVGLCRLPAYKNWAPDARYLNSLSGSQVLSQEILFECDGATEIQVWTDASGASQAGAVEFELTELTSGNLISREIVPSDQLPARGWASIQFNPIVNSTGTRVLLAIRPTEGSSDQGPKFAVTLAHDYDAGRLYSNGEPVDTDLVFKYGCVAGLGRMLGRFP